MVKRYRKHPWKRSKTVQRAIVNEEMDQPAAAELQTMWKSRKLWTSILLFVLLFITPVLYNLAARITDMRRSYGPCLVPDVRIMKVVDFSDSIDCDCRPLS
ncbi:hypothetical protein ACI65C_005504 [Semiaphis heraclei]